MTVGLLLSIALMLSACGKAAAAPGADKPAGVDMSSGTGKAPIAADQAPAAASPAPESSANAPQAKPVSKMDCDPVQAAYIDFGKHLALMVNFVPGADFDAYTDPNSPYTYLDFAKLRSDLDILATLPDPTDPDELATFGRPSKSVAYFRELLDVAENDIKTHGKPFIDTGANGQKILGISSPWMREITPFSLAMDKACSH